MNLTRYLVKSFAHSLLYMTGKPARQREQMRKRLTVLTYHSFNDGRDTGLHPSLPTEMFRRHLSFLDKHFSLVHLEEGLERLHHDSLPAKPMISLTVDDGFADCFHHGYPVFQQFKAPATIFLATDFLDSTTLPWPTELLYVILTATCNDFRLNDRTFSLRSRRNRVGVVQELIRELSPLAPAKRRELMDKFIVEAEPVEGRMPPPLTWSQVRTMRDADIRFGSHTVFHSILPAMDRETALQELEQSQNRISEELGIPCTLFAYPNGDHNRYTRQLLESTGYTIGLTQDFGTNSKRADQLALKRIEVPFHDPLPTFACRVSMALAPNGHRLRLILD